MRGGRARTFDAAYRVVIGLVVVLGLVAAVAYFEKPNRPEPVYRGRSLTHWLKRLDDGQADGISSSALPAPAARQLEAAEAIRAMGPQALPLLLQDLHLAPSEHAFRFEAERSINRLVMRVFHKRIWFPDVTEEDRTRWRAAQGLAALGPLAKPAVPELKRLFFTNYFHSSVKEAAYVLAAVGPEGIDVLTNAPQVDEWSGMCAIWALGQHPAAGTNVIPFLIHATESASEGTACGAIQVLGLFHTQGEQVIPALTAALANPKGPVRSDAARALAAFGPQATSAIPQLQALTNDPTVSNSALEALRRIQ